ncbi:ribonuclease J [Patescibacteria group bacterium]|nr:ribonuclease J [Patescibacteria group bacterium]
MIFRDKKNNKQNLRIISLGGFGNVTQNLFVYEYQDSLLMVDCGAGFAEKFHKKTELVIPDFNYLIQNQNKIKAIIFTHGHEDHTAGLPFFLSKIKREIPIYASHWSAALIEEKLDEYNLHPQINVINSDSHLNLDPFVIDFAYITHSIPDSYHLIIRTPCGVVYHGSDFKFDWTPVSGKQSDVRKIAQVSSEGIDLLLSDCLRSEKAGYTLSEQMIEESFEREIKDCRGKFFVTTMSSNVSRWQQALNVIAEHRRKAALVGRSVDKVVNIAVRLGYLKLPPGVVVPLKKIHQYQPHQLAFLISGAQAQVGSALDRVVHDEHNQIKIKPGDKVVFSTDYIPGSELAIHHLIDRLSFLGADVSYSEISDDIHVSGHAAQSDLALLISLTRPKWLLPIGGAFRQMKQYALLAQRMGYQEKQILLPEKNRTIEMMPGGQVRLGSKVNLRSEFAR